MYCIITYDERTSTHDYQPLYDLLNSWGAAHVQNSVWVANLNGRTAEVREALLSRMHPNDTVCVIELAQGANWAAQNVRKTGSDWLKANIRSYD